MHEMIDEETSKELNAYSLVLQQLLYNRGLKTRAEAEAFISPTYEDSLHNPLLLNDAEKAVQRILKALDAGERICIYSDYDCDGIPGAVLWHDFFKAVNHSNFFSYIPHRHYEGFGFNEQSLTKIQEQAANLIITVDCGTSDVNTVVKANQLGIDVIITDHHEPEAELPPALAIVNPKIGDSYPFEHLCGAGVVYKLLLALLQEGGFDIGKGQEKWWLDMVGLATVADMVPLHGENRVLAHYGLTVLRKTRRHGLRKLLQKQKVNPFYMTEDDIGFTIGPRINAASRMDVPEIALELLVTDGDEEAGLKVERLEKLNNERKGVVASMVREAHGKIKSMTDIPPVIVMGNPSWRPSLVGLVASKLAEEYNRPSFVWGRDGNGVIKGSCRSNGKLSVVDIMRDSEDSFVEFGGHHMSGGFAVGESKIHDLPKDLANAVNQIAQESETIQITVDAEMLLNDVTSALVNDLNQLAPFGVGNIKPIFLFNNVIPIKVEAFGKNKEHTKLIFDTASGPIEAIAFFKLPDTFRKAPRPDESINIIANIEKSFFMGRTQIRLRIIELF